MLKKIFKKLFKPGLIMLFAYGFFIEPDALQIALGVSVFLVGMEFLGDGFNSFSGGPLEKILKKSTDKVWKSINFGIISTTLMQSSSLVSLLAISFVSSGLITLAGAIGIVFGANIGTTTGAWLVATLGLKVKISAFAIPMIVSGTIIKNLFSSKKLKALGSILLGLGFLFFGIHFMKEGFEVFKSAVDLTQYSETGVYGLIIFTGLGAIATVVMQSSHATMALILVALSDGQITYENAIALAIGANIGTTVTAWIGALQSNVEGKRLAGAHFIFNVVTASIALFSIKYLMIVVDWTSVMVGFDPLDYSLKLAIFHTYFNVIGVIVMIPFIDKLVILLKKVFKKTETDSTIETSLYLNKVSLESSMTAFLALNKESKHMYENAFEIISHSLNLSRTFIISDLELNLVIDKKYENTSDDKPLDIDDFYERKIKSIYSEILSFATKVQLGLNLSESEIDLIYKLKVSLMNIAEAVKDTRDLQKNMNFYINSDNEHIKNEYRLIKRNIAELLRYINDISKSEDESGIMVIRKKAEKHNEENDVFKNGRLNKLVSNNSITIDMGSSLMNDTGIVNSITRNLLEASENIYKLNIYDDTEISDD